MPKIEKTKPLTGLAARIKAESDPKPPSPFHMVIKALAGTGKTTTLVEGIKVIKGITPSIKPSVQQTKIWRAMKLSKDVKTICCTSFGHDIVDSLARRVPEEVVAQTLHTIGSHAIRRHFKDLPQGKEAINPFRVRDQICKILGRSQRDINADMPNLIDGVQQLVELCKAHLIEEEVNIVSDETGQHLSAVWTDTLEMLAQQYSIEMTDKEMFRATALVLDILLLSRNVEEDKCFDYNDMIYLPVIMDLPLFQFDLLLVDEAQDLNKAQQEMAKRLGRRIILCGDTNQAIYAWAGADSRSLPNLERDLIDTDQGCQEFELTVTRRCSKAVVKEAQKLVPHFEAHPDNLEGEVTTVNYMATDGTNLMPSEKWHSMVKDGDMIICRNNAPLVFQTFRLLKKGFKANMRGRDVAKSLVKLVDKLVHRSPSSRINILVEAVNHWLFNIEKEESQKAIPDTERLIRARDQADCILHFSSGKQTIGEVVEHIYNLFTDDSEFKGIMLASIHKAKGLEAQNVFFLMPPGAECPSPRAKTDTEKEQERHLRYVGETRAIEDLIYVK